MDVQDWRKPRLDVMSDNALEPRSQVSSIKSSPYDCFKLNKPVQAYQTKYTAFDFV